MQPYAAKLDVLVVSEHPLWPLDRGFCVHGSQMAKHLQRLGLRVGLSTMLPAPDDAPAWMKSMTIDWSDAQVRDALAFEWGWSGPLARLRYRLADHDGVDSLQCAGLATLVRRHRPAAVLALGQHGPMLLRGIQDTFPQTRCVWYAADEPLSFYLSCMRQERIKTWPSRLRPLVQFAGIETLFSRGLDAAIGVSPRDTSRLRRLAGARHAQTIRNGVDLDYFQPANHREANPAKPTLVFWGRLDFEPNVDAMCWFARRVWPHLTDIKPGARLRIIGKSPSEAVRRLSAVRGVDVVGPVEDIRPHAKAATAVVLPMRCGRGIKNKLLEAAAMGLPIIASPRAVSGLELPAGHAPALVCDKPDSWIEQIQNVWANPTLRSQLQNSAVAWVREKHNWDGAAQQFLDLVNALPGEHPQLTPARKPGVSAALLRAALRNTVNPKSHQTVAPIWPKSSKEAAPQGKRRAA